jgi:hypothetical protein
MSQAIYVSDETYRVIETLARQQGTTPEGLAETLLKEGLAERQAILHQNAEWEVGLDEALARATRGENPRYASTDDLFAAMDETASERSDA